MKDFSEKLNMELTKAGFLLKEEMLCKLVKYYEMLMEKNKVMNLTAITEEDEFIHKHFIDSLSLLKYTEIGKEIEQGKYFKIIDVGTGAGFPGMVLKIVNPQLDITLFDSLKKRLVFLDEVIKELNLTEIRTKHGRAEDLGQNHEYRETYDLVLARAVANLSTLSEYCLPLVKKNGYFIAYKSQELKEELLTAERAVKILGGKCVQNTEFILPGTEIIRNFCVINKIKKTPDQYPRKAGTPSREPL